MMTEPLKEMISVVSSNAGLNTIGTEGVGTSAVAGELGSLITSIVKDFDSRTEATSRSQDQLSSALDRVTGELDKLLEDAPSPFIMQQAARISSVRNRVKSLNAVLKSIQRRIDVMDLTLSTGVARETVGEKSGEPAHSLC